MGGKVKQIFRIEIQLTDGTLYKRFKTMRNKASIEEAFKNNPV